MKFHYNFKAIGIFLILVLSIKLEAQVISVSPIFPKETDSVKIVFDATQGNGALSGVGPIYAHTGVITSLSANGTEWKHIVGNWGTADSRVAMKSEGANKWSIKFHMKNFYAQGGAFATGEVIYKMAFVFRNLDGTKVGRAKDGSDIFTDVYTNQLYTLISKPSEKVVIADSGQALNVNAWSSLSTNISLFLNGVQIRNKANGDSFDATFNNLRKGKHTIKIRATFQSTVSEDSLVYIVLPDLENAMSPAGSEEGVNYTSDTSATLVLYAPGKKHVFVIGDFSNWQPDLKYKMKFSPSQGRWWIHISNLKKGQEYGYQYLVDGTLKVHDPYSSLLLKDGDDNFITATKYPNLKPYPSGKTTGYVSILEPGRAAYNWKTTNFSRPLKAQLVIYEALIRDFGVAQSFKMMKDSIPYLKRLGITALQLMPVNEFEGNISWGYNPASHMAIDKYYGSREAFKELIDECHANGIAVILDAVFNHAFSQAAICQLYWDPINFRPAPGNPWVNVNATHPFNVGYDLNHTSVHTKYYFKRITKYLLEEYKLDGFRFDLSKGFTQKFTGSDVGAWSAYDQQRVDIWKDYHAHLQSVSPGCYTILEHFADVTEERELANSGMMFWGNANNNFMEANMGWVSSSDFGYGISHEHRNMAANSLVGYGESHDEERMMYKTLNFGNGIAKGLANATKRSANSHAFLICTPGPKMFWQFQENGYDKSIQLCPNGTLNINCKIDPKPILWNYWTTDTLRRKLYFRTAAINHLKTNYASVHSPNDYDLSAAGAFKRLNLWANDFNTVVIGNFDVTAQSGSGNFPFSGKWYEYLTGDSVSISSTTQSINLQDGEVRIYTNKRIINPYIKDINKIYNTGGGTGASNLQFSFGRITIYPNPVSSELKIKTEYNNNYAALLTDMNGKFIYTKKFNNYVELDMTDLQSGVYILTISNNTEKIKTKIIKK